MNDAKNIIDVDESSFNEQIIEVSENKLVIVDFWAPWCGPCKQLTPLLEKVVKKAEDKVLLAKVNIDENQQIAAQLRIQSIPSVFAFKNKQIVNAFQGVLPEKQIIEFIEKGLGEKLEENFDVFFEKIEEDIKDKRFEEAKEELLDFIVKKPNDLKSKHLYINVLIDLDQLEEAKEFITSLEKDILESPEIKSAIQKLELNKKNKQGPGLEDLLEKLSSNPEDINIICQVADKYFVNNEYEMAFDLLLSNYKRNKEMTKSKILEFFNALGHTHKSTIEYRKKFSQIMFS